MTDIFCKGVTKTGAKCSLKPCAKKNNGYCRYHTPESDKKNIPEKIPAKNCIGITTQGGPCKKTAKTGSLYCWMHNADTDAENRANAYSQEHPSNPDIRYKENMQYLSDMLAKFAKLNIPITEEFKKSFEEGVKKKKLEEEEKAREREKARKAKEELDEEEVKRKRNQPTDAQLTAALIAFGMTKETANYYSIRSKYRTLALEYHPDKGGDADKFKVIQNHYEILCKSYNKS